MRKKSKMGTKMRAMGPGMKSGRATSDKLKMVKNDKGQEVPFFAADGKGKMAGGGKTETATKMVPKGYFKGGRTMKEGGSAIGSGLGKKGGKDRLQGMLEGRERGSGVRGGPLKKEDIPTSKDKPILKKGDITKRKKPAGKYGGGMTSKMKPKGGKRGGRG